MSITHGKADRAAAPRIVADRAHEAVYERLVQEYREKHGKDPGNDQAMAEVARNLQGKRKRHAPRLFDGIMRDQT